MGGWRGEVAELCIGVLRVADWMLLVAGVFSRRMGLFEVGAPSAALKGGCPVAKC